MKLLNLPYELIVNIIFYLEPCDIYKILLTNTDLLNYNFQKICIPQIYRNYFICSSENTNEIYNLVKDLKNSGAYTLNNYINDLIDIIDSHIYHNKRDIKYLKQKFQTKKTINYIYRNNNDTYFNKVFTPTYAKIHHTYRINEYTYIKLKKNHPNVLALIY